MRVYLPATLTLLARWHEARAIAPAPLAGHGVTPALREWYAAGDLEELEYAAMADAARASLALLVAAPDASCRRVVVAVDAPDGDCRSATMPDEPVRSGVRLLEPLSWSAVAAVHVDDGAAEPVIAAAVAAWPQAQDGDGDAEFTVDEAEGWSLQWWASQEVPQLLAGDG